MWAFSQEKPGVLCTRAFVTGSAWESGGLLLLGKSLLHFF